MNKKRNFIIDGFKISQESVDQAWTMPYSHCHPVYEIYILEKGERTVTIDNMEYFTRAKDAVLFAPDVYHKSSGSVPFSGICIHFSERYLDIYFSENAKKILMGCFKKNIVYLSGADLEFIKNIADKFDENNLTNFLKLGAVLDIMTRSAGSADKGTPALDRDKGKKSQRIVEYVNENYAYIKRISDITDRFNVSDNYVFSIYRNNYSMTPKQYINKLRINNVCHRLKNSDKSIQTIAYDSGFDCYEHFIRVFKKNIGCTPSEYRKSHKHMPGSGTV